MAPTNKPSNGAVHSVTHLNGASNIHSNVAPKFSKKRHLEMEAGASQEEEIKRAKIDNGQQFLERLVPMMFDMIQDITCNRDSKVVNFLHPDEMQKRINFSIADGPCSNDKILASLKDVIKYSVKTGHPHFYNQLYGGFNAHGLGGALLTEALNGSQYTYEVAPVFTMMEKSVLGDMLKLIGFNDGDAMFTPGGSMANMYAINLARYQKFPVIKETGLFGLPKMCLFTSEKGHYSISKGAGFLGLGMDNVKKVKTDAQGRMIPEDLEKQILECKAEGYEPFMVNCTAGSTVIGAYDPVEAIADITERHGLWLHVDGAWGGAVLLSDNLKYKVKGIHRADSMTWNPHKLMMAPQQCACFFTKHKDILADGHSANAKYLFQQDKFYDPSYDSGDKSIQCGRKVDVLKLWTLWKSTGKLQMAKNIESMFNCATYLSKLCAKTEGFRMVPGLENPECTNVCFWYIPPSMRGQEETPEWWARLAKIPMEIKKRMSQQGTMMCGYQPDGDRVNFWRMVITNHDNTEQDMDFVVKEIARLGNDL